MTLARTKRVYLSECQTPTCRNGEIRMTQVLGNVGASEWSGTIARPLEGVGREVSQCPLWVKSRHLQCKKVCPLRVKSRHVQCTS